MLNETVSNLVAKVTGVGARIEELNTKLDAAIKVNQDSKAQIETLQGRINDLTATNADTEKRATQAESDLKAARERITALEKEKAELAASVDKQAGLKALEIAAQQGIPPLDQTPSPRPGAQKPATELHGLARVIAAFKEEAGN